MMVERISFGDIEIAVTRKAVKHVHLAVHPPRGRVTLVAPTATRLDAVRAYAVSRLGWIRTQRAKLQGQARESRRQYVTRETHYLWGRRYLLRVEERDAKPTVKLEHRRIVLGVRPGASVAQREAVMHAWHKAQLHASLPVLIERWAATLGVAVNGYHLQRMKTRWGSCNRDAGTIRLNTELAKKPKDLVESVVVHELVHLIEPTHSERFVEVLQRHYPAWREARAELNELPLGAADWNC